MSQFDKLTRVLASPPAASDAGDEWLDVQALYRVVRRRIGLILLVGTLVTLAFIPSILNRERSYSATARVLIHEALPSSLAASGLVGESDLNLTTEVERLVSRRLAVRVITELGLENRPEFNPALRDVPMLAQAKAWLRTQIRGPDAGTAQEADPLDPVVRSYIGRLGILQPPGSDVVSIRFESEDPVLAALIPNTVIRLYLKENQELSAERTARATTWIEGRIAEQAGRLAEALAPLNALKAEAEDASASAPGATLALTDLSERRAGIVRSRAELTTRMTALENADGLEARAEAVDTESVFMLMRQMDAEKADFERLLRRYGSAQEGVAAEARITAEARIAGLERSIAAEIERARRNLGTELAALDREERTILADLAAAEEALANSRRIETRLGHLQRVADVEQSALDALEQQHRALKAEADLPAAEIEVLSPATIPLVADGRSLWQYLAGAVFAAGALALTTAFVVEMLDKTVRSHEQLQKIPGITAAGFIPARRAFRGSGTRRLRAARQLYRDSIEALILALEQRSTGILPQSILVTSPLPREGVSTTAFALACELAGIGHGVLLVDADPGNGTLHERFGVSAEPGFSDYLAGSARLDEVIRHDADSGVAFVTRGAEGKKRHIDRKLTKALIASANASQQVVIFDAPPALVSNEALTLSGISARTLLVVRWGRTSRSAVEAAAERLSRLDGPGVDVVINRVNLKRQALYGYRDAGALARSLRRYYFRAS